MRIKPPEHRPLACAPSGQPARCLLIQRSGTPLVAQTGSLCSRISQCLWIMLLLLSCCTLSAQDQEHRVRNIVLVHGAWADGSGWKGVQMPLDETGVEF